MAGLLITQDYWILYSSSVFVDDAVYEGMKRELEKRPGHKTLFSVGGVSLKHLDSVRSNVHNIVKRLNEGEEVDVNKELSDFF